MPLPSSGRPGEDGPVVGVVIPAYRAADYIADTLRSVREQTFTGWECVVVDDGSPDSTADVVQELIGSDSRMRLVQQQNQGVSTARNRGISELSDSVRYIAFQDADDVWCDDALEVLLACLETDSAAAGSFGYAEFVDQAGRPAQPGVHSDRQRERHAMTGLVKSSVPASDPVRFSELIIDNPIWPPGVSLHRREVMEVAGTFDPDLVQMEDVDFLTRMSRVGHYVNAQTQVAWYRQHPGQATQHRLEFWVSHDALRRKTWASEANTPEQRTATVRAWRIAQTRRIARCSLRLARTAAGRDWTTARRLFKGLRLLVVQLAQGVPPVPNQDHVVWAGRDV